MADAAGAGEGDTGRLEGKRARGTEPGAGAGDAEGVSSGMESGAEVPRGEEVVRAGVAGLSRLVLARRLAVCSMVQDSMRGDLVSKLTARALPLWGPRGSEGVPGDAISADVEVLFDGYVGKDGSRREIQRG